MNSWAKLNWQDEVGQSNERDEDKEHSRNTMMTMYQMGIYSSSHCSHSLIFGQHVHDLCTHTAHTCVQALLVLIACAAEENQINWIEITFWQQKRESHRLHAQEWHSFVLSTEEFRKRRTCPFSVVHLHCPATANMTSVDESTVSRFHFRQRKKWCQTPSISSMDRCPVNVFSVSQMWVAWASFRIKSDCWTDIRHGHDGRDDRFEWWCLGACNVTQFLTRISF